MAVAAKIAPSMLSSDFANLAPEAERMLRCGADWLHMDIMTMAVLAKIAPSMLSSDFANLARRPSGCSAAALIGFTWTSCETDYNFILMFLQDGHFVPNLTIGAPVIQSLRKHTRAYLDCHLMVTNPLDYVGPFAKAGASGFTFHIEVSKENWQELIQKIKAGGMQPGVALRPGTSIEEVYPLVENVSPVELVLVMTVEPGFGGQKFMPEMMDKVRTLRKKYPSLDIEVDGGLGPSTIDMAASAGANCIVAGSSVFGAAEPAEVISLLRRSVDKVQEKR